ncbi:MAG: phage tail protein [Acidobacteriota bacterium]|nr:phage tail protein [Acidobacteriota bacterium]
MESVQTGVILGIVGNIQPDNGADLENWLPCDGKTHPINLYPALFAAIGARYGGDGVETFAVPKINDGTDFRICADGYFPMRGCPPSEWQAAGDITETIDLQVSSFKTAYEAGLNPFGSGRHSNRLDEEAMNGQTLCMMDAYARGEDPLFRHQHMDELDPEWVENQARAMQNANQQDINPQNLHQQADQLDPEWLERQVQNMVDAYGRGEDPLFRHERVEDMDQEWLKMQAQVMTDAVTRSEVEAETEFDGGDCATRPVDPNFRYPHEDEIDPERLERTVAEMIHLHEEGKGDRAVVESSEVLEENDDRPMVTAEEANERVNAHHKLKELSYENEVDVLAEAEEGEADAEPVSTDEPVESAEKPATKKPAAKKATAKKATTRKPAVKKTAAKKPAPKKTTAKKPAARKKTAKKKPTDKKEG